MKMKELLNVLNPHEFCAVSWQKEPGDIVDMYEYASLLKHESKILNYEVQLIYSSKGNEVQPILHILLDPSTHAKRKGE